MKTKMTNIWAGLALAGSLMAGSGGVSAAAIWQWDGTIDDASNNGTNPANNTPTWHLGNGPGPWQIKDQGPTTGGGDGDALFTFKPGASGPGTNNPFGSIANVRVSIQEQEIGNSDYYIVEFDHAEGNEPDNGAVTNLYTGDHFAYTVDILPPSNESIGLIALTQKDLIPGALDVTKAIYTADPSLGGSLITTLRGNQTYLLSPERQSLYIIDTINSDLTTDIANDYGVGVPEIDALAGTGALTLLGAALALAGERRRKHLPVTGELA